MQITSWISELRQSESSQEHSISSIPYGPEAPSGITPEHRFRSNPHALLGVVQNNNKMLAKK